ncbi:MAG: PadR family transcriptional regulator [Candidatus Dormibacteria bacterium]
MLGEGPRHGYQIIRELRDRFQGSYTPSAGSIYPRLRQLQEEGLIAAHQEQGRVVYRITDSGRAALQAQAEELQRMDTEIGRMAHEMVDELKADVRESARHLRQELRDQSERLRRAPGGPPTAYGPELRRRLERLSQEWGRVIPEGLPKGEVLQALEETLEMAKEHLREALGHPHKPD